MLLHNQLIQTRSPRNLIGSKPVCKSPYSLGCPAPMFAESVHHVNTTNKLKQCGSWKALLSLGLRTSCF